MNPRRLCRATLAVTLLCGALASGQNPDLVLSLTGGTTSLGLEFSSSLVLDNTLGSIDGWSASVCTDGEALPVSNVVPGAALLQLPSVSMIFDDMHYWGYTVGVVVDYFGVMTMPPGSGLELHVATFEPSQEATVNLCICPPGGGSVYVATVVVYQGGSHAPVTACGVVEVLSHRFLRGDSNLDGSVNIGDVVSTLNYLFTSDTEPCQLAIDANDDENFNIADAVTTLNLLFVNGPPLASPNPVCGVDPTPGTLTCVMPPPCP